MSDDTAHAIDQEVRDVIGRNYDRAKTILTDNMDKLHAMANALIKYETIDRDQIDAIMRGEEPRPPADWVDGDDGGGKPPSTPPRISKADPEVVGNPASSH